MGFETPRSASLVIGTQETPSVSKTSVSETDIFLWYSSGQEACGIVSKPVSKSMSHICYYFELLRRIS
jgi:hypothetical protein